MNTGRNAAQLSSSEADAVDIIKAEFERKAISFNNISIERRAQAYISLVTPNGNDFCRIMAGERSAWVSLDTWHCDDDVKNDISGRIFYGKNRNV